MWSFMIALLAAAGRVQKHYREQKRTYKLVKNRESDYKAHFISVPM